MPWQPGGEVLKFELEDRIHKTLVETIEGDIASGKLTELPDEEQLSQRLTSLIAEMGLILPQAEVEGVHRRLLDRVLGLGPLQVLLDDPSVTEIMVNDPQHIFVERAGRIVLTSIQLRDEAQLRHIIERIVAPLGRRIDESSPLVDARLPDGSRVNAIIPPLTIGSPALTIRKFSREPFTLQMLVDAETIPAAMATFLADAVETRRSIVISGGTGSGKTTTLNALSLCIPQGERLITIEDFSRTPAQAS